MENITQNINVACLLSRVRCVVYFGLFLYWQTSVCKNNNYIEKH